MRVCCNCGARNFEVSPDDDGYCYRCKEDVILKL